MALNVQILTIFPQMFPGFLGCSLTGKALESGIWTLKVVNIRDYAFDKHGSVDDTPCGGGAGMIMRPDVLGNAIEHNNIGGKIIYMSPKGAPLNQAKVHELSKCENLTFICGRFEGIDERVIEEYGIEELSIGDYVLTGGEQAAMIVLDAVVRLLPNVLGNELSTENESFEKNLLEYPQYTRPIEWKGRKVPDILLSGHHEKIAQWQQQEALKITKERRPDLLEKSS